MIIRIDAKILAEEIAHRDLLHTYGGTSYISEEQIFTVDENGDDRYTEKAQKLFDDLFDYWLIFIIGHESTGQEHLI
ncbi:MAG: hypothetical protein L7V85_08380 [Bacteroidia bacterium]|nr:hypothetical protein [Bacteroidia bacterium]